MSKGTVMLNFSNFKFEFEFEKANNQNFELVFKSGKGTKLKLFIVKMDKIGENISFNFINEALSHTRGQCHKTIYGRNLRIFVIS
jgi:hypothetical protein